MAIYFVTSNRNKFNEAERILGMKLKRYDAGIKELQSMDAKEVAVDKARRAYAKLGKPLIVEDTGLNIAALKGFPGALSSWVEISIGNRGICDMVRGKGRNAYAETCAVFFDGKTLRAFTGRTYGKIMDHPKGRNGFGWDYIFRPDGCRKVYAEMTMDEKNRISHRGKAFSKMKKYLEGAGAHG
ncbi:MAG: RdgB/HAM1 family non-canonical purine NTP pyrophosphatase [Candidatus Micrarchaeota archaeon]|nr:RdgB/HAM1 family non-canonical purine NTP pyrophosphatase [Candidatus Micrarchaeota archaeon]MDE1824193.1 RdgB/HAM1 family non-canonical purine NTP pyrophosphatase [Candidatus Micrarchaeota archaeon]MDE1850158.1 RdgB/HAM1 family non-canonical purine NTP pyrophosphatase [Candidatus Micrarchaeota archaeon]